MNDDLAAAQQAAREARADADKARQDFKAAQARPATHRPDDPEQTLGDLAGALFAPDDHEAEAEAEPAAPRLTNYVAREGQTTVAAMTTADADARKWARGLFTADHNDTY